LILKYKENQSLALIHWHGACNIGKQEPTCDRFQELKKRLIQVVVTAPVTEIVPVLLVF